MKKTKLILLLFAMAAISAASCKKSDNNDDNKNNNTIPDAVFNMEVTGAEIQTTNFTLPGGTATDNTITGAHVTNQQLLTVSATSLPITWMYNLVADVSSLETGTFNLKAGQSAFAPASQTTAYLAVSGTVEITKATLFQSVASIKDWYIDGNFSGTYVDSNSPPNQITVTGSFSGINVKAQ